MGTPNTEPDPISSSRRSSNASSSSPEFEFTLVTNNPQPGLLSADELFVDGVLLPLHLLHLHPNLHQPETNSQIIPEPETSRPNLLAPELTSSKRWTDIFKNGNKTTKKMETKKDRKKSASSGSGSGTELNINIWPFSRSRSAGTGTSARPRTNPVRKVSSAPCSRSNSAGESKSKKWPASPGRVGVHLGRASPVWNVRKNTNRSSEKTRLAPARVLNVPMCIPYRQHGEGAASDVTRGSNMFNIRSLFSTKKVY